jgi:hypothetical protein
MIQVGRPRDHRIVRGAPPPHGAFRIGAPVHAVFERIDDTIALARWVLDQQKEWVGSPQG